MYVGVSWFARVFQNMGLPGAVKIPSVCQVLSKYIRFDRNCQIDMGLPGLSKYCAFARAVEALWVCQGLSKSYGFARSCQTTMGFARGYQNTTVAVGKTINICSCKLGK